MAAGRAASDPTVRGDAAPRANRRFESARVRALATAAMTMALAGCPFAPKDGSPTVVQHAFTQPPRQAAACFARNAERHSSALVAEVGTPNANGVVIVEITVRNGVSYASAELRPAGRGSSGVLTLMVTAKGGMRQLIEILTEGC